MDAGATRSGWRVSGVGLALLVGAFLLVVMLGNAHGGYYPTSWGWTVLGFAWVVGLALTLMADPAFDRLELAFLASVGLLVAWTALSILWSSDVEQSVLEVQRAMLYLAGVLAALLAVRRRDVAYLLGGLVAAATWLAVQSLAERFSPDALPGARIIVQERLEGPVGYANALGLLVVMGALVALGLAVHERRLAARAAAGAALPVLLTAAYFTYSRGALLALAAGLLAAFALDPRRLRFLTAGMLVVVPSAATIWIAWFQPALTSARASPAAIADEGGVLTLVLLGAALASAVIAVAIGQLEPRIRVPRAAVRVYAGALALAAVALVAGTVIHYGGPGPLADRAYQNINHDLPGSQAVPDLNQRLTGIGSTARVNYWRVAWTEYEEHPLVGSGAGTFEQFWQRDRPVGEAALDGHSLYLESLAQLGWPGLLVVLCMLGLPFAAAVMARREPIAAGTFGAYVAYVVHTGVDWDWEMPILTLFALLCAVTLFTARDDRVTARRPIGSSGRAVAITVTTAVAAIGMVGLAGNRPLAQATEAAGRHAHREAEAHARTAARWAPWSAEAQRLLGDARIALGRRREGRANLRDAAAANPHDWQIWYDLGRVETGASRTQAFVRAATLNPMQPEIEVLRRQGHRLPRRRAPG